MGDPHSRAPPVPSLCRLPARAAAARGALLIEGRGAATGVASLEPGWLPAATPVSVGGEGCFAWDQRGAGDGGLRGGRWGFAERGLFVLVTSPSPTPHVGTGEHGRFAVSWWRGSNPTAVLHGAALEGGSGIFSRQRSGAKALPWQCLATVLSTGQRGEQPG